MPMKVIVCFDGTRVTVPCGDGDIPVSELITKAVHRYKRATGKGPDYRVEVNSLKTISGGGILDPDDQLNDVVDDREQLIADFDEPNRSRLHIHNSGDGASSTGTISPDVFQGRDCGLSSLASSHHHTNSSSSSNNNTDVVITPRDLSLGNNLRVRRGSDPGLNVIGGSTNELTVRSFSRERPSIPRRESVRESDEPRSESSEDEKRSKMIAYGSLDRKRLGNRFIRDATRASLSNRMDMSKWLESQESRQKVVSTEEQDQDDDAKEITNGTESSFVCLQIDGGPLGIHAVPALDDKGCDVGLLVQSIEPGRPVHQDGRIQPLDIIEEINSTSLRNVPFVRAQEIFRSAMQSSEIHLKIIKHKDAPHPNSSLPTSKMKKAAQPPPVMPKPRSHAPVKPSPLTLPSNNQGNATGPTPAPRDLSPSHKDNELKNQFSNGAQSRLHSHDNFLPAHHVRGSSLHSSSSSSSSTQNNVERRGLSSTEQAPATGLVIKPGPPIRPAKKVPPPAIPARNPKTHLSTSVSPDTPVNLNALTNTRRIGNKIHILLKKGPLGLGFSVTSRDNPTSGDCPIYIRNILPKGAAVQDGQLRPGDRLLQVNTQEMTGKSQAEAVSLLRLIPEGSMVELVVSRQEEVEERFKVPRPLDVSGGEDVATEQHVASSKADDVKLDRQVVDAGVDVPDDPISSQPSHVATDLDGGLGFPQEKLTFHIPLNETGSAGLGVSVKGKTQTSDTGIVRDLGIFIKTVLQGGAASKDGRLQINDQLLEINDVNLIGLSNHSAMEALRTAMMDDGLGQGHIQLTIARSSGGIPSVSSCEDSPNTSQGEIIPPYELPSKDNATASINHHRSSSAGETSNSLTSPFSGHKDLPSPIPPVRSKRVGALREKFDDLSNALRNESYTRATHDSLNESGGVQNIMPPPVKSKSQISSPRSPSSADVYYNDPHALPHANQPIKRPHSTIGFLHGDQVDSHHVRGEGDAIRRVSTESYKDDSDLSPVGDPLLPFSREGFGRQSMSEKRKGHLDPRSTEIYKQAKANKENKGGFLNRRVRSFHVTGTHEAHDASRGMKGHEMAPQPMSSQSMVNATSHQPYHPSADVHQAGMKRASSLEYIGNIPGHRPPREDLVPPNENPQNRESSPNWQLNRFGRARACNESFRAAVDRSYEVMDPSLMDTLEEESLESGAFTQEPSFSGRSSVSSETTTEDSNSLKRSKVKDKDKKGGLLKGFLRFGKARKSNEEAMRRSRSEERSASRGKKNGRHADFSTERPSSNTRILNDRWMQAVNDNPTGPDLGFYPVAEYDKERRRRASQQENERMEDEYARLRAQHLANQRLRSQSVDPSMGREGTRDRSSPFQPYIPQTQHTLPFMSRNQADSNYFHSNSTSHKVPMSEVPVVSSHSNHMPHQPQEGKSKVAKAVMSRAEKIQQLRSFYQQAHRQRQGVYPLDDTEEQYERQIQEMEQRWDPPDSMMFDDNSQHYFDRNQHHQGPPSSMPGGVTDTYQPRQSYPSQGPHRLASSSSQSHNSNNYGQQEASFFYEDHPPAPPSQHQHHHHHHQQPPHHHHHQQQQQHHHRQPPPHHETFYHSDQEELTSFSNTLGSGGHHGYHTLPTPYSTSDNEAAHPFYHNNPTQFHSSGKAVKYGHHRQNPTHSDSAKV